MAIMLPVLVIGGSVLAGKTLVRKLRPQQTTMSLLKQVDHQYQHFFQAKVDPLFGNQQRSQQLQEFSPLYNEKEADINRRLGLSIANTKLAVVGALVYHPLSWLSAANLVCLMWPLTQRSFGVLIKQKRLKYRLVAALSIWSSLAAGYYVVSNLMAIVVFATFKVAARTEAYSRAALLGAFAMQMPATVWLYANGIETEIPFTDLQLKDVIVLSAGQTIPIDGIVTEGMATCDQHVLTGEAQPVEKAIGDKVFANTVILTGKVYVQVEQTGSDTAVGQIGKFLSNIDTHNLEHEARSERMADRLTLPVLLASGLALTTIGPGGAAAIMNSGFGSIMFFSGSLSILSHLNLASHHGILVKDGRALERLYDVDTVVFDKTGTLTLEQPELAAIHCYAELREDEVLAYAALAEHRQTHPIAKAILAAAEQRGIITECPEEAAYSVGFGVEVCFQEQVIHVGSQRFMQQLEIAIPQAIETIQTTCQTTGNSLVFVAINQQVVGVLELQAQLRPETQELITKLHQRGLKLCILSGDHQQPTQHLAQRLHIDDCFAEVLPEGKADLIKQLQQQGRTVCFVGDGINDAVALRQADVSISLKGATSVATDSAHIVLMGHSLQQLEQLFEIAGGFNKNLNQTMRMAYIPGGVLIGGVFLFHFGMTAALLLYSSGVTAAVSNALSPLRKLSKIKS